MRVSQLQTAHSQIHCFNKQHPMKVYLGSGGTAPGTVNLRTRWR